ncbi:hypothetical protein ZIOFF_053678 [Zingiber officinale]|uniref:Uncharacterized protein n=1 Tax=Zingiber officinale TaxID=94328 RepID=A0A8J5KNR4_ZINOF|nr:hypothetical protein ZIOFF_053678 [Zingiber officinale]
MIMKPFGCLANMQEDQSKPAAMASPKRASSRFLGYWGKSKKQVAQVEQMVEDDPKKIKGAIRVKLVLSKKEAAQLLAMYVRGQEEMADKLVGALESKKNSRRSGSGSGSWRPRLESIPES